MRGSCEDKIASPADLCSAALEISGLVGDAGADRVAVRLFAHQLDSQPMIVFGGEVAHQQWSRIVDRDQHVYGAIVVEVADGKPPGERFLAKSGPLSALTLCRVLPSL